MLDSLRVSVRWAIDMGRGRANSAGMHRTTLRATRGDQGVAIRKRRSSAELEQRAHCVMLWANSECQIVVRVGSACNDAYAALWTKGLQLRDLAGLLPQHPGRAPSDSRRSGGTDS